MNQRQILRNLIFGDEDRFVINPIPFTPTKYHPKINEPQDIPATNMTCVGSYVSLPNYNYQGEWYRMIMIKLKDLHDKQVAEWLSMGYDYGEREYKPGSNHEHLYPPMGNI